MTALDPIREPPEEPPVPDGPPRIPLDNVRWTVTENGDVHVTATVPERARDDIAHRLRDGLGFSVAASPIPVVPRLTVLIPRDSDVPQCPAATESEYGDGVVRCEHPAGHPPLPKHDSEFDHSGAGVWWTNASNAAGMCPDGGTCHHACATFACDRVRHCSPLPGVFPGDGWPEFIRHDHAERESHR